MAVLPPVPRVAALIVPLLSLFCPGSCLCPALSAGPRCAGQAVLDGTCACTNGQTTPFEQKDHISKLVKRELPQAFYGPVVLAQDNPSANTGIKVLCT